MRLLRHSGVGNLQELLQLLLDCARLGGMPEASLHREQSRPTSLDGASHKLEVTVTRHRLTARARKSCIAERK